MAKTKKPISIFSDIVTQSDNTIELHNNPTQQDNTTEVTQQNNTTELHKKDTQEKVHKKPTQQSNTTKQHNKATQPKKSSPFAEAVKEVEIKDKRVQLVFRESMLARVDEARKQYNLSRNTFIELVLEEWLKNN